MSHLSMLGNRLRQIVIDAAERTCRSSGFVQRESKLTARGFIQAIVFGWMANPKASRSQLAQMAGYAGVEITGQGISDRFNSGALALLKNVFSEATQMVVSGATTALPLLQRFNGVWIFDASTVSLPKELAEEYRGCGDCHGGTAAVKLHVGFDLLSGRIAGPEVSLGRLHDRRSTVAGTPLAAGALVIRDLGYFCLQEFEQMTQRGVRWLSRLKTGTTIYDLTGAKIDLPRLLRQFKRTGAKHLECSILTGHRHVAARLLIAQVSPQQAAKRRRALRRTAQCHGSTPSKIALEYCSYTIAITNVAAEQLSLEEAMTLLRARWQVEILFKLWKSHQQIDEWQSQRPVAILCEFYAKLLAVLLTHWITLRGAWQQPDRSIFKAAAVVTAAAVMMATVINKSRGLIAVLDRIVAAQANSSRVTHRRKHPSTFQQIDVCSIP